MELFGYSLTCIEIVKGPEGVKIQIKADIGFMNGRPPLHFKNKPIYVCLLLDTSDGRKAHFARIRYVCHISHHSQYLPLLVVLRLDLFKLLLCPFF